jgi:hypothetical protein
MVSIRVVNPLKRVNSLPAKASRPNASASLNYKVEKYSKKHVIFTIIRPVL